MALQCPRCVLRFDLAPMLADHLQIDHHLPPEMTDHLQPPSRRIGITAADPDGGRAGLVDQGGDRPVGQPGGESIDETDEQDGASA